MATLNKMNSYPLRFRDTESMRCYIADCIEHGDEMQVQIVKQDVNTRTLTVIAPSKKLSRMGARPAKRKITKTAYLKRHV